MAFPFHSSAGGDQKLFKDVISDGKMPSVKLRTHSNKVHKSAQADIKPLPLGLI